MKTIIKELFSKAVVKKVASVSLYSTLFIGLFYVLFSPVIITVAQDIGSNSDSGIISFFSPFSPFQNAVAATASSSTVVSVVVSKEITVTAPANFSLTGTINGITGGTAVGTGTFYVLSSNPTGFAMSLQASSAPALATGSYSFVDYVPLGTATTPDATWASPAAGTTSFSYSVGASGTNGADALQKFKYTSTCNTSGGTNTTAHCFVGFTNSAVSVISTSTFSTTSVAESVFFKAAFTTDGIHAIYPDTYKATVTATVNTN